MEIEEVAAHNADVYNPGRLSAQKRKREKAQDQLRNRMRKRNNVVSTRLRSNQRDRGETTLLPGVMPVSSIAKRNSRDEWSCQEARDITLAANPDRLAGAGERRRRHGEVPLTELVDRVIHRRGHATSNSSPMTIRALKPPAPPYAIQHPTLIRKIQPINQRKPTSGGPYVVVLKRSPSSDPVDAREPRDLPPLKQQNNSSDVEVATWRPELTTTHEPYVHPNAEDRSVTNYRLQMQQAIKIAELRGDFSTSMKPMHKPAPLPAIQVAYKVAGQPQATVATADGATSVEGEDGDVDRESAEDEPSESRAKPNRFTSSQEVLKQMQARKHAKRKRGKVNDFNNPLRTRNRFTSKMKLFKEDLQKARELSMIQEDQSSISDRLSRLSAGRTSVASFRSVGSLKRIEESEVPGYTVTNRLPGRKQLSFRKSEHQETNTDISPGPDEGVNRLPKESQGRDNNSSEMSSSVSTDVASTGRNIHEPGIKINLDNSAPNSAGETDGGCTGIQEPAAVVRDENNTASSECKPDGEAPPERLGGSDSTSHHDEVTDFASDSRTSPQVQSEDSSSPSESQVTKSIETGVDESTAEVFGDAQVVRESRLAVNQKSYEKADSDRGIAADTFHIKDLILPAERVQ